MIKQIVFQKRRLALYDMTLIHQNVYLKTNKCSLLFVSILSEDMLLWLASPDLCA